MTPHPLIRTSVCLLVCTMLGSARAQSTGPVAPEVETRAPLPDGPLDIVVTAVEGTPQYRLPGQEVWQFAKVGERFKEGVEFRTGMRGTLQFLIEPQEYVRVDRQTSATVLRANVEDGMLKSNIGMKYGRLSSQVDAAGRPHESLIVSPNGALATKGTGKFFFDQPGFPPEAGVIEGQILMTHAGARAQLLGRKGKVNNVRLKQGKASAAETALEERTIDPTIAFARTPGEERLVQYVLNSGATFGFDRDINLPTVRGGTVPMADTELVPILPGVLNFVLRWDGNADINLGLNVASVQEGQNEFIYPRVGFNTTPSGGRIPFDHRGGPNGGFEVVYWPKATQPDGQYLPFVVHQSGGTVNAKLDVFQNGRRLDIFTVDPESGLPLNVTTLNSVVRPGSQLNVPAIIDIARSGDAFVGPVQNARAPSNAQPVVTGSSITRR